MWASGKVKSYTNKDYSKHIVHVKDKTPKERKTDVVHGVRHTCSEAYVRETKQTLKARIR